MHNGTPTTRRALATLLVAGLLAAACGSSDDDADDASASDSASASASASDSATAPETSDSISSTDDVGSSSGVADESDESDESAGDDTENDTEEETEPATGTGAADEEPVGDPDATRTVSHLLGESEVPVNPQRIAVLGRRGTLPILLDLGFEPVGAIDASFLFGDPFHPLIMDEAGEAGVEPIPFAADGPNLEEVALLQPDLIIGNLREYEAVAEQLQQIAPVIALQWNFIDPIANVRNVASLMGVPDEAEELIADYEAQLAAAAAATTDVGTVSIAGFFSPDDLRVYRDLNTLGQIVARLGGELVPTEEQLPLGPDVGVTYISEENIDVLSGESLITFVNLDPETRAAYDEEIARNPLVQALPGFQNDRVLEVDPQLVFGSAGLQGLRVVLDQLVTFFAN